MRTGNKRKFINNSVKATSIKEGIIPRNLLDVKEILTSFGNSDYIGSFITYYADQIIKNKEYTKC